MKKSHKWEGWEEIFNCGVELSDIPSGLSKAPVKIIWEFTGEVQ